MEEKRQLSGSWQERIIFFMLILSAVATFLVYLYFSFKSYFMLDDIPLIVESGKFFDYLLKPIGSHFRPMSRIHFFFHKLFGINPTLFHLLSLLLHAAASAAIYKTLKNLYDKKVAIFTALLFFTIFSYNETLYWISVAPLIYCMIFSMAALYFFKQEKVIASTSFTFLASISYEVWMVLPPVFLIEGWRERKKRTIFIFSLLLLAGQAVLYKSLSISPTAYGTFKSLKEIPLRLIFYLYRTFNPFLTIYSNFIGLLIFLLLTAAAIWFFLREKEKIKVMVPASFYFVPGTIFLLSEKISSRFFYFPVLAISLTLVLIFLKSKKLSAVAGLLIAYLALVSPVVNYLDGLDYMNFSLEYRKLVEEGRRKLLPAKPGEVVLMINRVSISYPRYYTFHRRGRLKLLFERTGGLGGLMFLHEYANFLLYPEGMEGIPSEKCRPDRIVVIGKQRPVSSYCFKIKPLKDNREEK